MNLDSILVNNWGKTTLRIDYFIKKTIISFIRNSFSKAPFYFPPTIFLDS